MSIIYNIPTIYEYIDKTIRAVLKFVNQKFYNTIKTVSEHYNLRSSKMAVNLHKIQSKNII